MCGRFALYGPLRDIYERYIIDAFQMDFQERYNIAPSQQVLAVVSNGEQNRIGYLKWGLVPGWAKDPAVGNKMINARAETLAEKPSFREAYKKRRCIIPVSGFYEWQKHANGKTPMYIHLPKQKIFSVAGLWERWTSPDGQTITTCTIVTTEPNELMEPIHNRMPVILDQSAEKVWLDRDADVQDLQSLLVPYPADLMQAYAVSSQVNSPKNDNASLITKLA